MYEQHAATVQSTLQQAIERSSSQQLAEKMFSAFFEQYPETREKFEDFNMEELAPRKFYLISDALLDTLKFPLYGQNRIEEEVYRHLIHDVRDREYYFVLLDLMMAVVKETLSDQWSQKEEEHWLESIAGMKHLIGEAANLYIKSA